MGLFKPGWMNKDVDKALHAVEKLTDQAELAKAAKNASIWSVRKKAIEKLTDQAVLIDIANNDKDGLVRKAAVKKITDGKALATIAKNDEHWEAREEAVKRINNQAILLDLASNGTHNDTRYIAAARLNDKQIAQKMYAEIAKNEGVYYYRQMAVERLIDQAPLLDLAKNDKEIRKEAIKCLNPESLKSLMLFCCDVDTSDLEKERDNTILQLHIAEALSNKLPEGFSKLFVDIDEYKKVSEKFKYKEEKRVGTTGCYARITLTDKFGFDFPPFEG